MYWKKPFKSMSSDVLHYHYHPTEEGLFVL